MHAAAYYLNPQFHYSPTFKVDAEVKRGLYDCMLKMFPDIDESEKIDQQLEEFKHARGLFGSELAIRQRTKRAPGMNISIG